MIGEKEKQLDKIYELAKRSISSKEDITNIIKTLQAYQMLELYDYKKKRKFIVLGAYQGICQIVWIIDFDCGLDIESGFTNDPQGLEVHLENDKQIIDFLWTNTMFGLRKFVLHLNRLTIGREQLHTPVELSEITSKKETIKENE